MKKTLLFLLLAVATAASAQYNPQILKTLYTGTFTSAGVRDLIWSKKLNNLLFFNESNGQQGNNNNIYVTDGTAGNTILLKTSENPSSFAVFGNYMYFTVLTQTNGRQLWKSDGTVSGTSLVETYGGDGWCLQSLVIGNKMYFVIDKNNTVKELRVMDAGSNTSTLLLQYPVTSANNLIKCNDYLTEYNGKLYFSALTSVNGPEIYASDGTVAGTKMVKEIKSGPSGSNPFGLVVFNNKIYFMATDDSNATSLWSSDGTESGTNIIKTFTSANAYSSSIYLAADYFSKVYNGRLYFSANRQLWATDGTANGTIMIKSFTPSSTTETGGYTLMNGKLYFNASNGTNGYELWVTEGTEQSTQMAVDFSPGSGSGFTRLLPQNLSCGNQLFFAAKDGNSAYQPHVTDGTLAGTKLIKKIDPTGYDSIYLESIFVQLGNKILFVAQTGSGRQLYVMDAQCLLGTQDTKIADLKIYPNPATDLVNIVTKTNIVKTEIYSMDGKLVLQSTGNKKQIVVKSLLPGTYLLNITGEHHSVKSEKIIIK